MDTRWERERAARAPKKEVSSFSREHSLLYQESAVPQVTRGPTFALRRSTLDFCLGGQRSVYNTFVGCEISKSKAEADDKAASIEMREWERRGEEERG